MQHGTYQGNVNGAKSEVNEAKEKVQRSASTASGEFKNFVSDIEDLLKSSASLTGDELEKAKEKISERISQAKESLTDVKDTIVEKAKKTACATDDYVHEHTWTAVGAGAAIGLFVGFLLARK